MFFDDVPTPFRAKRQRFNGSLRALSYPKKPREFVADPFEAFDPGDTVICDSECYRNFWLVVFKHVKSGKYFFLQRRGEGRFEYGEALSRAMWYFKVVTFNGNKYDLPMINAAIAGDTTNDLKERSDEIIKDGKVYHNANPGFNHIDIWDVAPLPDTGLKTYAGRLHAKRLQELPIHPDVMLSFDEMDAILDYCCNDCDNTELLWLELAGSIELREAMSAEYKTDLRSKSDAQIAEAVLNTELKRLTGYWPKKPEFDPDFAFKYEPPESVGFRTQQLRDALETIKAATFELDAAGSPQMPEAIALLKIKLGSSVYQMGMGGLHSTEKSVTHRACEKFALIDRDVASFYPRIILNNRYYPEHLGPTFLAVYGGIVERRLAAKDKAKVAKKAGASSEAIMWAIEADGLKITINGSFGKFGNMYSTLYSPKLLIQTTITGQLCLLMLIEAIEYIGINVISANTDGIIIKCPRDREDELAHIIAGWENWTNFETEETRYKMVCSRDVNSYAAVKEEGGDPGGRFLDEKLGVKTKGAGVYCERGSALNSVLSKNPEYLIINDALVQLFANGKPVEETINECQDIRRFIAVKNVRGGGHQDGLYLGKVVRWYFANANFSEINYVASGNKVGGTDGAKPLMELPDEMPGDVNRRWYIEKTYDTLDKVGFFGNRTNQATLL